MRKLIFTVALFLTIGSLKGEQTVKPVLTRIQESKSLTSRQQGIVLISAFTANGDLEKLENALHPALSGALTVNETKRKELELNKGLRYKMFEFRN